MLPLIVVGIFFILLAFFIPFDQVTKSVLLAVGIGSIVGSTILVRYALKNMAR